MNQQNSSVTRHTYHVADGQYQLPNDSVELARLEDQAASLVELMQNNVIHARATSPSYIIDIGCGTGTVTCYLGARFPSAQVYGVDLSPVRACAPIPSNVSFIQGDFRRLLEHDARFSPGSIDYIFHRLLVLGMTDWAGYISDVASLLRPGGWAEMQDYVIKVYRNGRECSTEWGWLNALNEVAGRKGIDLSCGSNIAKHMEQIGLVDITVREFWVPFGAWAADAHPETKKIGEHAAREYGLLYYYAIPKILEGMGYEEKVIKKFQESSLEDLSGEVGKEIVFYVTTGRKP
ncbi:MAG: hypothetical protein Q9187_002007 [Circinaria calcarea]